MEQPNKSKEAQRQLLTANAEPQQTVPRVFHITAADYRNPAYDFTAHDQWIEAVDGEPLQTKIDLIHRYMRQAVATVKTADFVQDNTTPNADAITELPISEGV